MMWCDGCTEDVPAFAGDHCQDCEDYCRREYGPCVDCGEQGYARILWPEDSGDLCMRHYYARRAQRGDS